jgi:hypothetical protein
VFNPKTATIISHRICLGTKLKALLLCTSLALLAGCSPHPGSGIWIATSENEPGFKKIDVQFEGRADIYTATDEVAVRRCFWGSMSPKQLALDCVQAANTEIKENYRLIVSEDDTAELTLKQQLIGTFSKQPRTE